MHRSRGRHRLQPRSIHGRGSDRDRRRHKRKAMACRRSRSRKRQRQSSSASRCSRKSATRNAPATASRTNSARGMLPTTLTLNWVSSPMKGGLESARDLAGKSWPQRTQECWPGPGSGTDGAAARRFLIRMAPRQPSGKGCAEGRDEQKADREPDAKNPRFGFGQSQDGAL